MHLENIPHVLRACPDWAGLFIARETGRHPDRRLPSHEIIFVRSGLLDIQEENTRFRVQAGETLFLRAGRRHLGCADGGPPLEFFWVHFETDDTPADGHGADAAPLNAAPGPGLSIPQHAAAAAPQFLETLFRHYLAEQDARRLDPARAALMISLMLREIARPPSAPDRAGAADSLARRAEAYAHAHAHRALTASEIAQVLGCNASYLSRVYRRHYGRTLTDGILRRRMDHARHLLTVTDDPVAQVARACGMEDASYFLKLFKRHTGLTALAFRRQKAAGRGDQS